MTDMFCGAEGGSVIIIESSDNNLYCLYHNLRVQDIFLGSADALKYPELQRHSVSPLSGPDENGGHGRQGPSPVSAL